MASSKKTKKTANIEDEALDIIQNAPRKKASGKKSSNAKSKTSEKKSSSAKTTSRKSNKSKKNQSNSPTVLAWIKFAAAAILLLAVLCAALFDVSRVTSNAMMPTLARNDLVVSWAPIWGNISAHPGHILLVDNGDSESAPNYLRLIANNAEDITYHSDKISVNGTPIDRLLLTNDAIVRPDDEPEIWRETLKNGAKYKIMLPQHAIRGQLDGSIRAQDGAFLAGDNRMASYDSRQNGLFQREKILGRALFVLESARNDGIVAHWLKWID